MLREELRLCVPASRRVCPVVGPRTRNYSCNCANSIPRQRASNIRTEHNDGSIVAKFAAQNRTRIFLLEVRGAIAPRIVNDLNQQPIFAGRVFFVEARRGCASAGVFWRALWAHSLFSWSPLVAPPPRVATRAVLRRGVAARAPSAGRPAW